MCPYSLVDEERLKDALGEVECPKRKSQLLSERLGLKFASAGDMSSGDKLLARKFSDLQEPMLAYIVTECLPESWIEDVTTIEQQSVHHQCAKVLPKVDSGIAHLSCSSRLSLIAFHALQGTSCLRLAKPVDPDP